MQAFERGYSIIILLVTLAVASLGLSMAGPLWSHEQQRQREQEFVRIGQLYAQALARYRLVSPGTAKLYPQRLEDLLLDTRFIGTMRHLRQLYPDPTAAGAPWVPIRDDSGRIIGVRSSSHEKLIGRVRDSRTGISSSGPQRYSDWHFLAEEHP